MKYTVEIPEFEGPLDLLLHLIKRENINIKDICIDDIIKQYMNYIDVLENLNLNVASEYLVMAAELMEIKSSSLLPKQEEYEDEEEIDPKQELIKKLLEYEKYKNITPKLKEMENYRNDIFTKEPTNLIEFNEEEKYIDYGVDLTDLMIAFSNFIKQKEIKKPLNTKIAHKEYSVRKRCIEIKNILKKKKTVNFIELFNMVSKEYVVVTFLAVLSMSRNQEIEIEQEKNFKNIIIKEKRIK